MKEITTEQILEGIVNNNNFIIIYVYKKFFKIVSKFILDHGGKEDDARDIFQDGLMVIYEQRKNSNLRLDFEFSTYFYAICKNKWLRKQRDSEKMVLIDMEKITNDMEVIGLYKYFIETEELFLKEERLKVYQHNFEKMSEECRKLLRMVANGLNIKEIQIRFDYKSEGFTYKKRSICKTKLIYLIKQDKNYNTHEDY